jgi:hypothetical protein
MKTRMNPPFSKISFLLFHDQDSDGDIDSKALPASARELADAVGRLATWSDPPTGSVQGTLVFHEYAESLKADTLRLVAALQEPKRDNAIRVFESLRKKCDSCHHFFRFDESASLGTTPAGRNPGVTR